jgi:hypothetical protein
MLLDFPIEPDASTMEIISDSVYANSSVLDGRRFATEFVSRRKADIARARNGSANGVGNGSGPSGGSVGAPGSGWGKATSIADGAYFVSWRPCMFQVFDLALGSVSYWMTCG